MAAVHGSSAATSMEVLQTQNTAPVLEFRCLFTQDLRRKQKRWQDGRLKFHTFNKRVMVYDNRSNFVGDTHWREDSELEEGEELELERGGYLVQVQDFVSKRDQDLSELVDKRLKEKEERAATKSAASPAIGRSGLGTPAPHLKPKGLNTLLTPSGHYGRAVLSTTSPFEERQRLANGDGNENDRPAKRRKTVESTQSKNGYAQNLMGASLTLTSSKPPGTASIRYEPFKTKPSIQQVPTKTIDLTIDDDDGGEVSESMQSSRKGRQTAAQKAKRYRSPPPKSTYASNLTGTALSLSRPEPSRNIGIKPAVKATSKPITDDDGSSAEEEHSFPSIDSIPGPVPIAREPATKKVKPKPTVISSSPSPPIERRKKVKAARGEERINHARSGSSSPVMEIASKKSKATPSIARKEAHRSSSPMTDHPPKRQKSAASLPRTVTRVIERESAEQPVSALRIKAKPRRQMMMLMERPSSRSSLHEDSTPKSRTAPKASLRQINSSNEPVLSQATMQLNAFCEKQEQRLQARLNGQRPRISLDLDDLEDLGSSPLDNGINHQAIDNLLTRKPVPIESTAEPTPKRPPISNASNRPCAVEVAQTLTIEVQDDGIGINGDEQILPNGAVHRTSNDSVSRDFNGKALQGAAPVSPKSPPQVGTVADSVEMKSPKPVSPVSENERLVPKKDLHDLAVEDPSTESVALDPIPAQSPREKQRARPQTSPKTKPRPPKPPKGVNVALEYTTEHLQAIVKSSSASPPQANEVSPVPENTTTSPGGPPSDDASDLQKPEPASSELNLKQSPKPSPVEQTLPAGQIAPVEQVLPPEPPVLPTPPKPTATLPSGFRTAQTLHATTDPAPPTTSTINAPRPKLLNPATRGKSLQKTVAESNDALALTLKTNPNMMPPGAPRIGGLLSRVDVRGRDGNGQGQGDGDGDREGVRGGYEKTGPWSRESFDLFGNWRPPGRGVVS